MRWLVCAHSGYYKIYQSWKEYQLASAYPQLKCHLKSFEAHWRGYDPLRMISEVEKNPVYGETPPHLLLKMRKAFSLHHQKRFVDVGAGRGRLLLFAHFLLGIEAWGVEKIPSIKSHANDFFRKEQLPIQISYRFDTFPSGGDWIYLYGLCMEEEFLSFLAHYLSTTMKKGDVLVSVGFPLTDYLESSTLLVVKKVISLRFPWGKTEVYLQERGAQ